MKTGSILILLLAVIRCSVAGADTEAHASAVQQVTRSPQAGDADFPTPAPSQRHTEKVAAVKSGAWAQAIEPTLARLMGDKPLAAEAPSNSALIPVPKLENDSYDWYARHADVLRIKDELNPEVVLIGDSITHFWGGEPRAGQSNGPDSWRSTFGDYRTLNLGFGWDRIQNVLWRLDHGELDGLRPRVIVLHIGTNNTSDTPNARSNSPDEIAEGIGAVLTRIRAKAPDARIILMAVFPREQKPDHPRRTQIAEIN